MRAKLNGKAAVNRHETASSGNIPPGNNSVKDELAAAVPFCWFANKRAGHKKNMIPCCPALLLKPDIITVSSGQYLFYPRQFLFTKLVVTQALHRIKHLLRFAGANNN